MKSELGKNSKHDTVSLKKSIKYYSLRYIQEILEAYVAYSLFKIIAEKPIDFVKTFKMSLIIGLITFMLEEYNSDYKNTIKNGIFVNIGTQFVKS